MFSGSGDNSHLHAWSRFAAGAGLEARPVFVADDGAAFGHAVTHRIGEIDHFQKLLHILVEGGSADDDDADVSSKCLDDLFADGMFDFVVDDGDFQEKLHGGSLQLGDDLFLDNLLNDERHGDDQARLDFGKGLENDLRTGHPREKIDVAACGKLIQKFKSQPVHVGHGQDAHHGVAGLQGKNLESELCV